MFHLNLASRNMQTSFVWIFLLLSHVGAYRFLEEFCGTSITFKSTISANSERYDAWLATVNNKTHFQCHGTLIHKHFVLTAAHCASLPGDKHVVLGSAKYAVSKFFMHRGYPQNDIGLLNLTSSVVFSDFIYPICIILDKDFKSDVENWWTFNAFASSPRYYGLEAISLNRVNRNHCQSSLAANPICAKSFSTQAPCRLELGSPLTLYVPLPKAFPREVQLGIRSYGNVGCSEPGAYTDLTSYGEWIETTIKRFEFTSVVSPKEKKPKQIPSQGVWLYENCSGNTISSKLRAFIYGPHFEGQGWFITDRFIITNAMGLPDDAAYLDVGLAGTPRPYDEFRVLSVFKQEGFSEDFKNDIAILKLNRPVTIDQIKPVCMFTQRKYQESTQSTLPFTIFDYVQTGDYITILEKDVEPIDPRRCSDIIGNIIEPNQICVQAPQGMSHNYGNRGDLLAKKILYKRKYCIVLVGILSYTSNGLQVFTNVIKHTDWITQIVTSNR